MRAQSSPLRKGQNLPIGSASVSTGAAVSWLTHVPATAVLIVAAKSSQPFGRQGVPSLRQRSRTPPRNRLSTIIVPTKCLPEYTLRKPGTQEIEDRAFPIPGFLVSSAVYAVVEPATARCRGAAFYTERSLGGVVETYPAVTLRVSKKRETQTGANHSPEWVWARHEFATN